MTSKPSTPPGRSEFNNKAGYRDRPRWHPAHLLSGLAAGLFGLALARAALDTWPVAAGALPRWPLAGALTLACAAAGWLLSIRASLPFHVTTPLLLPAVTLAAGLPDPVRDWALVVGAVGGAIAAGLSHSRSHRPASTRSASDSATPEAARQARFNPDRYASLYPLSLSLCAALLYWRTVAPTVGEADTFEMQVNVIRLGISHGSGYPLYLLLAKLLSLLPLGGTPAFRVNLSAAAFGVTAALACFALARSLGASRPAAWLGGLSLAVSIGLWSRAVEAEVYTLHVSLVGLLLLIFVKLAGRGAQGRQYTYLAAFVFGLSLTNHLTTALLAPAAALALVPYIRGRFVSSQSWPARLRHFGIWLLVCSVLFGLGLSVYLYLPIRWPAVNHGEGMSWELFKHFVTGQEAQGALRLNAWYTDPERYTIVGGKILAQFGWPGVFLAGIGLAALWRRQRLAAVLTLMAWAAYAYFALSFYVPDPDFSSFLLPAHLVQAAWLAAGVGWIAEGAGSLLARFKGLLDPRSLGLSVVYSCAFLLPAGLAPRNMPRVDKSADWAEYRLGQYILSQPLKQGAAVLADSELIAPLYYLQVAEGVRPDLDIMVLPSEAAYRQELDGRVGAGQAVYLGRYLPHLADAYYLHSVGPLTEVKLEPSPLPPSVARVEAGFGSAIVLRGFALDSAPVEADSALRLTLYWQALQPPPGSYLVSLRLIDPAGTPVLTGPAEVPAGQMYPTAAWPANDVVADFHSLELDPALAPGLYRLQVSLAPPFSRAALPLADGQSWLTLTDVTVSEPATPPNIPRLARMKFGAETWLLGYEVLYTSAPGSTVSLKLYWHSPAAATAEICAGQWCGTAPVRPGPTVSQSKITFTAPAETGLLPVRVAVRGLTADCAWWPVLAAGRFCDLPPVAIAGAALGPNAINFDNRIVLEDFKIESPHAGRGGLVIVLARWRGLAPMADDYTAFVHLLGPDGLVHGQVDTWPVQGTRATSGWSVGEVIPDRFEVRVPDDAPAGAYQVEVGWYLLATLDRLPVLDPQQVAIDDKYVADGLAIGN